jgi:ectoine hydroxylase-related dioxygenase (phytanoyl-CoA dioxygenase family)
LFEKLFGETAFVHPHNIARLVAPHKDAAHTPPHQDFIYAQGTRATYTYWFALGECPRDLGGLSVMRFTHKEGILPISDVEGAGGAGGRTVITDDLDREWVEGDLQT